jgi:phage-related protein
MLSANAGADALSGVLNTATQALSAIASGASDVLGGSIALNASFESSSAVIQAYTGSQEETERIMSMLKERASESVFSFDSMARAVQGLIPASKMAFVPVDELMTVAEQLGASNMAEGIDGAAFALREAVSGDFTSVIERFNLPRAAINSLKEQGVPALDIIRSVMGDLGISMDLVSAQANTFNGRSDRFRENLELIAADAAKPIFDALSEGLEDVIAYMADKQFLEFVQTIKDTVESVTSFVVGIRDLTLMVASSSDPLATFLDFIDLLIPGLGMFAGRGREISAQLRPLTTFIADNLVPILITLGGVIGGALIAAFIALVAPIAKVIAIGGAVVLAIGAIGIGIKTLVDKVTRDFPQVVTIISDIFADIEAIFRTVGAIIVALVEPVLRQIVEYWNEYGDEIIQVVTVLIGVLTLAFQTGMRVLRGVVELILALIKGDWSGAVDAIKRIVNALWTFLSTIFGGIVTFLLGIGRNIERAVKDAWTKAVDAAKGAITSVLTAVIDTWNNIKRWLTGNNGVIDAKKSADTLVTSFFNWLSSTGNGILRKIQDAFDGVKRWISSFRIDAGAIAKTIVASLLAALIGPAGLVAGAAVSAFTGLSTWLGSRRESASNTGGTIVDSLKGRLSSTTEGLTKAAGDAFSSLSTWLSARTESGAAAGASIVNSVKDRMEQAAGGLNDLVGQVFNALVTFLQNVIAGSSTLIDAAKSVGQVLVNAFRDALMSTSGSAPGLQTAVRTAFEAMRAYLAGTVRLSLQTTAQFVGESIMRSLVIGINANSNAVFQAITRPVIDALNRANRLRDPSAGLIGYLPTYRPLAPPPLPTAPGGLAQLNDTSRGAQVVINIGSVRDQRDIDAIERAVTRGMSEAARRGVVQSQLPRGI